MFGKIINGVLVFAPSVIKKDGKTLINPNSTVLLEEGYFPVITAEPPVVEEGFLLVTSWIQEEGCIKQEWLVKRDMTPMSEANAAALFVKQHVQELDVDNNTAIRMKSFYPSFESIVGKVVKQGFKFTYNDKLWSVEQPELTIQSQYTPGTGTESLYSEINETHDGTLTDPIPYDGNMALEQGKYYIQYNEIYFCKTSTINPVVHKLSELVDLYVEAI